MQGVLEMWINAFIPKDVADYTKKVPSGVHAGKTAVPLPGIARLHPGNLLHAWNEGFLTDQRTFNNAKSASVRMQSSATVKVSPTGLVAAANATTTSGTIAVDTGTGKELRRGGANLSRCFVKPLPPAAQGYDLITGAPLGPGTKQVLIDVKGAGSDPLVHASADIDYVGQFQVILRGAELVAQFKGKIDSFPAFEAYASYNGSTQTLFTAPPPPGKTVVNLLGKANRPMQGRAVFK